MGTYAINGTSVQISTPVEVGHAQGHHWFSTLHQIGSHLICEVVTSADTAQGKWPGRLYLSWDAGESWRYTRDIDSLSHTSYRWIPIRYCSFPMSSGRYRQEIGAIAVDNV